MSPAGSKTNLFQSVVLSVDFGSTLLRTSCATLVDFLLLLHAIVAWVRESIFSTSISARHRATWQVERAGVHR
jgi:hypothetical protein